MKWYQEQVISSIRKSEYKALKKKSHEAEKDGDLQTAAEIAAESRKVFDSRFLLMCNRKTLETRDEANRKTNDEVRRRYSKLGKPIPEDYRFRSEDNAEKLQSVLDADERLRTAYVMGEELKEILSLRDVRSMEKKLGSWLDTAKAAHISQLTRFTKTIERLWDGIISIAVHGISSGIIEGTNAYIKNMRRSAFGYSDFDFFGLMIWEHTHQKAMARKTEHTGPRRFYRPRSGPNKRAKPTIYIKERNPDGSIKEST